jgi:ankyrin repeat protein
MRRLIQAFVCALLATGAQAQSLERLLDAVERGDAKQTELFLAQGLDPNSTGPNGQTILMAASRLGQLDVVKVLLARKANPNRQSPQGDTALMLASLAGHLEVVKVLFASGARLDTGGWNALHYAAYGGSPEIVRFLVLRGADKNAVAPNWDTPLMLAVRNGRGDAAKALLEEKPDLGHRGKNGETALALAKARGEADLVRLLLAAGAAD